MTTVSLRGVLLIDVRRTPAVAVLCAATLLAGCDAAGRSEAGPPGREPAVAFDVGAVTIRTASDTLRLRVEIAEREDQRSHGLMERAELPDDAGMIFLYSEPQPETAGFWMFRTLIPLDIAFVDDDGRIVAILEMQPCQSPNPRVCRIYSPGVGYASALEVNRGFFARHGIGVGDHVTLER
jgi:uncharacterized protein